MYVHGADLPTEARLAVLARRLPILIWHGAPPSLGLDRGRVARHRSVPRGQVLVHGVARRWADKRAVRLYGHREAEQRRSTGSDAHRTRIQRIATAREVAGVNRRQGGSRRRSHTGAAVLEQAGAGGAQLHTWRRRPSPRGVTAAARRGAL